LHFIPFKSHTYTDARNYMDNIEKRIDVVKNIISSYFYNNNIEKSSCLAQSYILYKVIYDLTLQQTTLPLLVKGYIINHTLKVYYGHFWVEYNDCIYDIGTQTYLLDYKIDKHDEIKKKMRVLVKTIPEKLKHEYKNIDNPNFEIIRNESYLRCMENKMLEDVKEKTPSEIYHKIKCIHDKLIH
jgi:hypothetical protein